VEPRDAPPAGEAVADLVSDLLKELRGKQGLTGIFGPVDQSLKSAKAVDKVSYRNALKLLEIGLVRFLET
jgi:hypothetical protein